MPTALTAPPRAVSCGCCTGGCVCPVHQDPCRGLVPQACAYHRTHGHPRVTERLAGLGFVAFGLLLGLVLWRPAQAEDSPAQGLRHDDRVAGHGVVERDAQGHITFWIPDGVRAGERGCERPAFAKPGARCFCMPDLPSGSQWVPVCLSSAERAE